MSPDVLAQMKMAMQESSNSAASHSFLLDDDSAIPFTHADVERMVDDKVRGRPCWVLAEAGAARVRLAAAPEQVAASCPQLRLRCALQDLLRETPVPRQLKEQPSFAFLAKRLEVGLHAAA